MRGFPTLIVTIPLLGGLQLIATDILGECIGRMFIESKSGPLYLIDDFCPSATTAAKVATAELAQCRP